MKTARNLDAIALLVTAASWMSAVGLVIEDAAIALQAYCGTTSHFNVATPFNTAVWVIMGAMTFVLWAECFLVGVGLVLGGGIARPVAWAMRFGVLIALVGMSLAYFMVPPTAAQLAAAQASAGMPIVGAHTVGVADGGAGLPVLGWSTTAGDVRIPHFIGLHGLQVIPLVALCVTTLLRGRAERVQTALIAVAGVGYLGFDLLLAWQAGRGQSIVHPDALTLGAATALVAATALAVVVILTRSRPARRGVG